MGFEPQGWDLGLETRIWASRGGGDGEEEEGEGGGEISPMCESIGHRSLWCRCPKKEKKNIQINFACTKDGKSTDKWTDRPMRKRDVDSRALD